MALLKSFPLGDLVRLSAVFTDQDGVAFDPEFVRLEIALPDGATIINLSYENGDITRKGAGSYYYDFSCDNPGLVNYRYFSTGNGQAAQRDEFRVDPEFFTS